MHHHRTAPFLEWYPSDCRAVTHTQIQAVTDLVNDPWQNLPAGRREELERLRKQWMDDFFPQGSRAGIEA